MVTPHPMHPSPLQTSGGLSKCKAEESSRCTGVEGRHHQEMMNSEAVNAICKLYKKWIAAKHQFIQVHLRPYFFGARLIPIAKKDGGIIRSIVIGTIFHKLISSAIMYSHVKLKEKLPGTFSLCSWSGHARRC